MSTQSVVRQVKRIAKVRGLSQSDLARVLGVRKATAGAFLRWPDTFVTARDVDRVAATIKTLRRQSAARVYKTLSAMAECGAGNAEIEIELGEILGVVRKVGSRMGTDGNSS